MTDTTGWASPGSPEPTGEDVRPTAAGTGAAPDPSAPQDAVPQWGGAPGPYGGGYGNGNGGGHGAAPGGWGMPGQYPGWGAPPSPKPGVIPLRPLGVGELLDGSVSTVRRHWRTALGLSLGLAALEQTLQALLKWWAHGAPGSPVEALALVIPALLAWLLNIFVGGLLTIVVSKAVLGEQTSLKDAWKAARPRFGRLAGLTVLNLLIVVGVFLAPILLMVGIALAGKPGPAALLLFAPLFIAAVAVALWLGISLSLAAPAVVLERQGVVASLRRSWRLVKGSWWRIFGINLLTGILVFVIAGMVTTPFTLAAGAASGNGLAGLLSASNGTSGLGLIIIAIGGTLASTVTIPVQAAMTVLIYIDQRIRREALDIELARAAGLPEYGGTGWAGQGAAIPGQTTPPGA